MDERGLAHHARRAANAPADAHSHLVKLRVRSLKRVRRGAFAFFNFRFVLSEILDNRRNRILRARHAAALKLVRISVAHQTAQLFQMLLARARLVVIFYERDAHKSIVNREA
jgi:hypothetical protein